MNSTLIKSSDSTSIVYRMKSIWEFRYLCFLLIKRNIVIYYKQTILGPLWFILQPIFTTVVFVFVFNKIGKIDTGEIPPPLFYMFSTIIWSYFSETVSLVSSTFTGNAGLFSKVYFPRFVLPISIAITNLSKMGIQMALLTLILVYLSLTSNSILNISFQYLMLLPLFIIQITLLSIGIGMLICSWTTKFKDLSHMTGFGLRLMMFLSPIIYPLSTVPEKFKVLLFYNPLTVPIEGARTIFMQSSILSLEMIIYSITVTIITFFIGFKLFTTTESRFIDTI